MTKPEIHIAPTKTLLNLVSQVRKVLEFAPIGKETPLEVLNGMVGYALLNKEIAKSTGDGVDRADNVIAKLKDELQNRLAEDSKYTQYIQADIDRLSGKKKAPRSVSPSALMRKLNNTDLQGLSIIELDGLYSEIRNLISKGNFDLADYFWRVRDLVLQKSVASDYLIGTNHNLEDLREKWVEQRRIHLTVQNYEEGKVPNLNRGIQITEDLSLNELALLKASLTKSEDTEEPQRKMLDSVRHLAMIKALRADDWFDAARGLVLARSIESVIDVDGELEQYYNELIDGYLSSEEATDDAHAGQTLKIKAIQNDSDIEDLQPDYHSYLMEFMTVPDDDVYGEDMLPFMQTGSDKWDFRSTPKLDEKLAVVLAKWLQDGEDPGYVAAMTTQLLDDRQYTDWLLRNSKDLLPKTSNAFVLLSSMLDFYDIEDYDADKSY